MFEAFLYYDFIRNAVFSGLIIGFIAPLLGVFLVVRRLSMIADALSHVTLSGIAFSLLLGKYSSILAALNPIYLGMVFSIMGALSIEKLRKWYAHYQELAIPIILSAGIGSGVVFISLANGFNVDLYNYLFGSIMAVSLSDLWTIIFIGLLVVGIISLFYKELFSLSFDEENAKTTGIPRSVINFIFIIIVALVIATAIKIVGILLVSSLMVLPVAAGIKLSSSFKQTILFAILFGELSVFLGMWISFELDWAPGGTIVILSFLILCSVIGIKKWILRAE